MRLTVLPYFILKHKVDADGLVMLSNAFEFIPAKSRTDVEVAKRDYGDPFKS